ncbi:synaptosomal-associated protein 47 [Carassius gibelio]|uniref:synaptosomal-associated protein 47 n=1 Tax=Carassius gibelio TaxID=101364 RepID=UPI002277CD0D|nr:synaptosomal-associated protein 47 [Carassius gibelio]
MSQEASIHSWPGSYYINSEKRWASGILSLTRTTLRFNSEPNQENLISLRLSHIMEIKMETSGFIFSALTVLEQGNTKHWFGSLKPCRTAVYHVLEHFWRERLLSPTEPRGAEAALSKGQELISLISGAQRRLEDTGKVLDHQGEQFDNMIQGLDNIESDLSVADKLLSELECPSWWPFGKLPWKSHQQAKSEAAAKAACAKGSGKGHKVITSIPAIVSHVGSSGTMKPGSLIVLVSSLEVRDANGQLLHCFEKEEVDDVYVHSPYEISVRQRFIGKPDICFLILSARMTEALSVLEMQYKKKVVITRDYAAFQATSATTPGSPEGGGNIWSAGHGQDMEGTVELSAGELTQLQLHVLQPTVTEAEAQELRQMLQQLKTLALEAETELERQDEALDVLSCSADRTTMNINRHTRRMRKLL